ncbi:MAG: ribosome maturation factor RimP [Aeromicrobium sp.]|uniref:ribosome maturation factor RimP n=1 Tax=Aeromicrobium sp. TaxID=1871063 RepID=UPI0039E454D8
MEDRIDAVVREIVEEGHGLDLDDLTLGGGKRRLLRIVVDADGGVGSDDLGSLSREISQALDVDPAAQKALGQGPYTLEVTSRGVDRPLTLPRHWRRNIGRLVAVAGVDERKTTGRIAAADDDIVTLEVDGEEHALPLADIATAFVRVELNRKDR